MEPVNKKAVFIAAILALLTTFLVFMYINKATTSTETIEYLNVYVASKTLPAKHLITDEDIDVMKVANEYINPQAVLNKADIIGKRLKDRVIKGEQILKDRLVGEGNLALAFSIPDGKRAVSINVNEQIAVGNHIRPGDYVDIIVTFQSKEMEDNTTKYVLPPVSKIVIQNVQVLALGQNQTIETEKIAEPPSTVTLAVTPQEAEQLVFCSDFGVITLALRPAGDTQIVSTPGAIRDDIAPKRGVINLLK